MSKEAINRYLTEAMGECWHSKIETCHNNCPQCGEDIRTCNPKNYQTNEGYGKLRDFYDGWDEFKKGFFVEFALKKLPFHNTVDAILYAFHRDNLALLMAEFLQGEG